MNPQFQYRAALQKVVAAMSGNSAGQSHSRKHRTNRANAANSSNRPSRLELSKKMPQRSSPDDEMTDFSSTISPTPQPPNKSRGSRHAPGVPQPAVASKRVGQSRHKELPEATKNSSRRKKKGMKTNRVYRTIQLQRIMTT